MGARRPNYSSRRSGSRSVDSPICQEVSRPVYRPLRDETGPLDFSGEQDALSLAVWGRDGLQLQEVQQHLDLPGHSREEERGKWLRGMLIAAVCAGDNELLLARNLSVPEGIPGQP